MLLSIFINSFTIALLLARHTINAKNLNLSGNSVVPTFEAPKINYKDLLSQNPSTSLHVSHILTTLGFLQILDIPNFPESRILALKPLSDCLLSSNRNDVFSSSMSDGSIRLTTGASSHKGISHDLPISCAQDSSRPLREIVDSVTRLVLKLIDKASSSEYKVIEPYDSHEEILNRGEHLEHLHVYYPPTNQAKSNRPTMEMHTDNGIMIAMTAGLYQGETPSSESGLYAELPSGAVCRVLFDENSLIIMVGEGSKWLSPTAGASLRPVPHAMIAGISQPGSTRSWYGKMILPPADALIKQKNSIDSIPYHRYRTLSVQQVNDNSLPAACGSASSDSSLYQLLTGDTSECKTFDGTDGVLCWMQCRSVSELACGLSAQCVDTSTNEVVDGTHHCPHSGKCELQCPVSSTPTTTTTNSFNGFCYGTGISMIMEGFMSQAFGESGTVPCINLLFTSWTLNSSWKFALGCIGVFAISVGVQYMTYARQQLRKIKPKQEVLVVILTVFLYVIQVAFSYFIMLAAMTYSAEIFAMVCLGLTTGFAMFNMELPSASPEQCCSVDIDVESTETSNSNNKSYQKIIDSSTHSSLN